MPNFSLPDSVFEAAAARFPTPFHLYDERGIRENARARGCSLMEAREAFLREHP